MAPSKTHSPMTMAPVTSQTQCTDNGERASFWLKTRPEDTDTQKAGLLLFSLLRGLTSAMKGEPMGGASCDIHPTSILAIAGEVHGIAIGPVVYVPNTCWSRSVRAFHGSPGTQTVVP